MSAYGMTKTILATQLSEAIRKDDKAGFPTFEIAHGKFGPAVTSWVESVAEALNQPKG